MSRFGTTRPAYESGTEEEEALREQVLAERRRTEEAQARLAAIVESSEDPILSKSLEGTITSWNAAAERLLGYRADEVNGRSIMLIIPPEHELEEAQILERLCRGERLEHHETVRLAKDGRRIDVSLTSSPIRDRTGQVIGASTIIRDITRRKGTERALRGATERLELAQEAAQIGTFEWDRQSNEITWSPSMEMLYGLPPGGFGRTCENWRKMVHPEDWPAIEAAAGRGMQTLTPWKVEFRIVRPDGAVRWIVARARVIPGERGVSGRVVGINIDITERKQAEEALRQSAAYFRQLANAMPQIVWVARPDGWLDYYNQRWYEFTGFTEGRDDLNSWRSILHPEDMERCLGTWHAAVESGQPFQVECRLRDYRSGRYRWFLARALPVRNERGEIIRWFGTSTDIEEQKRAEAALAIARDQLEEVVEERTAELRRTVAELEAFCYSLSHDMRAPLRAIQSYVQLVLQRQEGQIGSAEKEFLHRSLSAAHRMDLLIRDVLAFSRLSRQEVSLHAVNVDRLAREIIQERPELQPPRAEVHVEGLLATMWGHEALLTQCLTNLLGNAVKYVAPGVKPQVRLYSEVQSNKVRLWVADNGIGIEREAQEKLFGLFQRLHRESDYEGTGVGLAIVRRAAERMGGQVGVESEPGRGSRFWVELRQAE